MRLLRGILTHYLALFIPLLLWSQSGETDVEVYGFDEGLSHRNVFQIVQDERGYLWIATINGLNRFDGYQFTSQRRRMEKQGLLTDFTSSMVLDPQGDLWVSSPDFLSRLNVLDGDIKVTPLRTGKRGRHLSMIPTALLSLGTELWVTTYSEGTRSSALQHWNAATASLATVADLPGNIVDRPLVHWHDHILTTVGSHRIGQWEARSHRRTSDLELPRLAGGRIVDLQVANDKLWVLLSNGALYVQDAPQMPFWQHSVRFPLPATHELQHLYVEPTGHIWVGGLGHLWQYDALRNELVDYDAPIRQLVKNTCTYRQVMRDLSGTVWVATNFGAVRITQNYQLFTHYLSGGSEYCADVYCSTRGITEDDDGLIYTAYYSSIHVIDPRTNDVRPLFPANDYRNSPYGILYHEGYLYTGNGQRIRLADRKVDTLFEHGDKDLGSLALGQRGEIWIGYQYWLYRYHTTTGLLEEVILPSGNTWNSAMGTISYLFPAGDTLWIGTLDSGLYGIDTQGEGYVHYHTGPDSPVRVAHQQINAIYVDGRGYLWLATAAGLQCLNLTNQRVRTYTQAQGGLPNDFINGLLPEGDSCLWVSTDNGLCRLSLITHACTNFYTADGLSHDEFNRISFYQSRSGRLYFGGLNGVNAFEPSQRFLYHHDVRRDVPLHLHQFTYLNGQTDSVTVVDLHAGWPSDGLSLTFRDRIFTAEVMLADYRAPHRNEYSYYLEGFDQDWSEPATDRRIRYTDIPPGSYTLRVRGRTAGGEWSDHQLALPLTIELPYYRNIWFWIITMVLFLLAGLAVARYRIYLGIRRRRELQAQVNRRTQELAHEKQKSEELLLNILPADTAEELKRNGKARAQHHRQITVLFSDFKDFSRICQELSPEELVAEIDHCYRAFDDIVDAHQIEKIKTIGDAYLCIGGLAGDGAAAAVRTVRAAMAMQEFMQQRASERGTQPCFRARIGLHTGPVVAGVVGTRKFAFDIWGATVNIASRMETQAPVDGINVSEATYQLVCEQFAFSAHGAFVEHGETVQMYTLDEAAAPVDAGR